MASPIKPGFEYKYSLNGVNTGAIFRAVMQNSKTLRVGEACRLSEGGVEDIDATTDRILGVVEGIISMKPGLEGRALDELTSGTDYNGTYTATQKKYAASSDNTTVDLVNVLVRVDPVAVYSMSCDATPGTTRSSDEITMGLSLSTDGIQIDESTATTDLEQVTGLGVDPDDSNRILGCFVELQIPRSEQEEADA